MVGVRTGDMGVDKEGKPKANFQPGMDIFAKVTVLGEGVRGTLAKQLIERFDLEGPNPQTFETGIKEIWRINPKKHQPGRVVHGMQLPGDPERLPRHVALRHEGQPGLVRLRHAARFRGSRTAIRTSRRRSSRRSPGCAGCSRTPSWCATARRRSRPAGSTRSRSSTPTARCWSATRRAFCNAQNLAGIHMAMKSGMLAAETLVDALAAQDFSAKTLGGYAERYRKSWAYEEHHQARNFGALDRARRRLLLPERADPRMLTNGRGLADEMSTEAGHLHMKQLSRAAAREARQGEVRVRRQAHLHARSTWSSSAAPQHEVDQPSHLVVADTDLCARRLRRGVRQPVRELLPGRRLRDGPRSGAPREARSSSSTTRTACTARPATSPIPTR